jgi:hypothetical protein
MNTVKVIFNNGDYLITNINGTKKEVKDYYLNNIFNIGTVEDKMVKCVKLEFIN